MKNINFNVFLFQKNFTDFKQYIDYSNSGWSLKDSFRINKSNFNDSSSPAVIKGEVFVLEKNVSVPYWLNIINEAINKTISLPTREDYGSIVFLKLELVNGIKKNVAITFGNVRSVLKFEYIDEDFGIQTSKYFLNANNLKSFDSISLDSNKIKTTKSTLKNLTAETIKSPYERSSIQKIYGSAKNAKTTFSIGGKTSLNLSGLNDFKELAKFLTTAIEMYLNKNLSLQKFDIEDNIKRANTKILKSLNKNLGTKLEIIFNSKKINNTKLRNLTLDPPLNIKFEEFIGFWITGIGMNTTRLNKEIDTLSYFLKLKEKHKKTPNLSGDQLIHILKTNYIHAKHTNEELDSKVSLYKSLYYECTLNQRKYLLYLGKWFEINSDFYSDLKTEIDLIPQHINLNYISFDKKKHFKINSDGKKTQSEGKYNEDLATENQVLMLDRTRYAPNDQVKAKLGLHHSSNIEIADIFGFDKNNLEFIHVKRHSNSSGMTHLFSQATISGRLYLNDTKRMQDFIKEEIKKQNNSSENYNGSAKDYNVPPINFTVEREKHIVLAIIDEAFSNKKPKPNSAMFTLLELVALYEAMNSIKTMGYKLSIKFIETT